MDRPGAPAGCGAVLGGAVTAPPAHGLMSSQAMGR